MKKRKPPIVLVSMLMVLLLGAALIGSRFMSVANGEEPQVEAEDHAGHDHDKEPAKVSSDELAAKVADAAKRKRGERMPTMAQPASGPKISTVLMPDYTRSAPLPSDTTSLRNIND